MAQLQNVFPTQRQPSRPNTDTTELEPPLRDSWLAGWIEPGKRTRMLGPDPARFTVATSERRRARCRFVITCIILSSLHEMDHPAFPHPDRALAKVVGLPDTGIIAAYSP